MKLSTGRAYLLSFICISFSLVHALQGGPVQPDYLQFESVEMPDLVNPATGDFAYNEPKLKNAALVVVMCARTRMDDAYLRQVLDQETKDGRLATEEARVNQHKVRSGYVQKHENSSVGLLQWSARQVYIALGFLLLGAAEMGIDACPIEGFDATALDKALDLESQGLTSQVLVALGRSKSDLDFNAGLPKSRLDESAVITEL